MAEVDVVARLQLRAEQFSSETGKAFAGLADRASRAAADVRQPFMAAFADVNRLASQGVKFGGGKLNLNAELSSLQQAATAADRHSAALRTLALAQTNVAESGRNDAQALRLEADAAGVAAQASERDAQAIRARIAVLKEVQAETVRLTGANDNAAQATARNTGNVNLQRAGYQQLGFQLNDVATSLMGGAKPAQVFAQQSSQLFQALQMMAAGAGGAASAAKGTGAASEEAGVDVEGMGEKVAGVAEKAQGMGGKLGAVAGFMAGPWGAAVTVALSVLTPFVFKMFEHNDAVEDAVKALRAQAAQEAITEQANERYEASLDGLIAKTKRLTEEMGKRLATQDQIDQAALTTASVGVANAEDKRGTAYSEWAAASLDRDRFRELQRTATSDTRAATYARQEEAAEARMIAAQGRIAKAIDNVAVAHRAVRQAELPIAERQIAGALDASAAATDRYTAALGRLRRQREDDLIPLVEYRRQLLELQRTRDKEVKAAQDASSGAGARANQEFGRSITSAEARRIAEGAGMQVNSADRTNARQQQLYDAWIAGGRDPNRPVARPGTSAHERGNAIDIQRVAGLTVEKIKAAFAAEGVRVTKIISEAGAYHVEWRRDATAARDASAAARDAGEAQRGLAQDMDALTGAFDPAAAAAAEYALTMERIARLTAAGKLSLPQQIEYAVDARDRLQRAGAKPLPALGDVGPLLPGLGAMNAPNRLRDEERDYERQRLDAVDDWRKANVDTLEYLSGLYGDLFNGQTRNITDNLRRLGSDALGKFLSEQTLNLVQELPTGLQSLLSGKNMREGLALGQVGGGAFASITGGKNNALASSAGGVLGEVAGKALGPAISTAVGGALGKTLGGAAGPIGSIVGGMLGSALGGLLAKKQNSGAGISTAGGSFAAGGAVGTSAALKGQASGLAGSVSTGLQRIADMLGAEITGTTDVRIGTSNGNIHINRNGGQIGKKGSGDENFGADQEGAVKAAIADALADGVLSGVSEAAQRILRSGQDIDRALTKALAIESIPKTLKAMLDPVGAALDDLNRKWKSTIAALDEGGASAEQRADAERLYKLQLDQVKASTASASQGLKDFLTALKIGSNSPYSLRDQESAARAQLDPFLTAIAAGQSIDQAKYQAVAQSFLEIERQMYGSTEMYFAQIEMIQAATNRAIADIDNAVPITAPVESPFVRATAASTADTAAGVMTGNEIASQQTDLLGRMTAALEQLAANGGSFTSGFIGDGRNFVVKAA